MVFTQGLKEIDETPSVLLRSTLEVNIPSGY
jgi:hypothetical protein